MNRLTTSSVGLELNPLVMLRPPTSSELFDLPIRQNPNFLDHVRVWFWFASAPLASPLWLPERDTKTATVIISLGVPHRRRITLGEARRLALGDIDQAEARRLCFAEDEAARQLNTEAET
jgi:hypothetical protein